MSEKILRIPIRLTAHIDGDQLTLKVHESTLTISVADIAAAGQRVKLEPGRTIFDEVLRAAKTVVRGDATREFTAAELYATAYDKFGPSLRRNTWGAHVIACAPNHSSYRHHTARRDYFNYLGGGRYRLNSRYIAQQV